MLDHVGFAVSDYRRQQRRGGLPQASGLSGGRSIPRLPGGRSEYHERARRLPRSEGRVMEPGEGERLDGKRQLAMEQEGFRLLVEGVKDYAILMLDPEGTIISWNEGAQRIKGYSEAEALGRHFSLFYTPEANAEDHPARELEIAIRDGRYEEEGWRLRKDGTRFWANVVITALLDDHGNLRGFAKVTRDMTERRAEWEERERFRVLVEGASHAKTEFLSRMSHELRTPLNAVLGFAQLLSLDALRPQQREAVDQIQRAGELLLALVEEVLDISRIEADRLAVSVEPVHVGELVMQCVQLAAPMAAERAIRIVPPPRHDTDVYALADQQRLKQVLLNLLSNGVKYNRPQGTVWLKLAVEDGRVVVSVGDSGRGIDPASIDRLFMPFERLGAEGGDVPGTGLGLALSKRLAELMGATITVESELGKGSVFHVSLEAAERPAGEGGAPVPAGADPSHSTTTVLYIEDNLANMRLVEQILAHAGGVELISAMQGKLGLELARTHRPDIILLDLHLPDMSGEDVAIALKEGADTRGIPIVVLTGAAHSSQRRRLLDLGVHAYLTKPFNVAEMIDVVEQLRPGRR
jgi:PAS domain S-box-containing protein